MYVHKYMNTYSLNRSDNLIAWLVCQLINISLENYFRSVFYWLFIITHYINIYKLIEIIHMYI